MAAPDYTPSFPKIPLAFMGASTDEFDLVRKRPGLETGSNLDTEIAWSITCAMLNLPP